MKTTTRRFQRGASVVHWLFALVVLLAVGAFAIDLNNVVLSRAELQNAADAGALEGARQLYNAGALSTAVGQCAGDPSTPCDCTSFSPADPACDAANANVIPHIGTKLHFLNT
jgi:uncharacterized membrane protein